MKGSVSVRKASFSPSGRNWVSGAARKRKMSLLKT